MVGYSLTILRSSSSRSEELRRQLSARGTLVNLSVSASSCARRYCCCLTVLDSFRSDHPQVFKFAFRGVAASAFRPRDARQSFGLSVILCSALLLLFNCT